jgi:hypothetical protein
MTTGRWRNRTSDPLIKSQQAKNHKSPQNQALTESPENVLASCLALLTPKYPELALVVNSWPNLPEHIKAAVKALINSSLQGESR